MARACLRHPKACGRASLLSAWVTGPVDGAHGRGGPSTGHTAELVHVLLRAKSFPAPSGAIRWIRTTILQNRAFFYTFLLDHSHDDKSSRNRPRNRDRYRKSIPEKRFRFRKTHALPQSVSQLLFPESSSLVAAMPRRVIRGSFPYRLRLTPRRGQNSGMTHWEQCGPVGVQVTCP